MPVTKILRFFGNSVLFSIAIIFLTIGIQLLVHIGNSETPIFDYHSILGNSFAWILLLSYVFWAWVWLFMSSENYYGPATNYGNVPIYKANGLKYYTATILCLAILILRNPEFCTNVYKNAASLLGSLNLIAILVSTFLYVHSKMKLHSEIDPYLKDTKNYWFIRKFYRGMDLHPRFLGVDLKQLIIVRIGLMLWQVLVLIYFVSSFERHGLDPGQAVSVALQSMYLYRFFASETAYFNTLDITLDRMGFYLCWGSLVGFPALYTFSTFYFVEHKTGCNLGTGLIILAIGLSAIHFKCTVDSQKQVFRESEAEYVNLWKTKPKYVIAEYCLNDASNSKRSTKLLVSGWWGIGRKINYSFELLISALSWCSPAGLSYGVWPFIYFIFLLPLLLHRIHRDEVKCRTKYREAWDAYCKIVPYKLIPKIY